MIEPLSGAAGTELAPVAQSPLQRLALGSKKRYMPNDFTFSVWRWFGQLHGERGEYELD